jgi:hypothetical protein
MKIESYSGGGGLQKKLGDMLKKIRGQQEVKVGFLEGATYPDGMPVAMVAAIQNFGAPAAGIPARPFFSNMVAEKSTNWGESLGYLAVANDYDMSKALALMGEGIGSQLQQSIKNMNSPALADATVVQKGFDKPLIDTAHMINSVSYQVDGADNVVLPSAASGESK